MNDKQLLRQLQLAIVGRAVRIRDLEKENAILRAQVDAKPKEVKKD